jgi:hypothetical protein
MKMKLRCCGKGRSRRMVFKNLKDEVHTNFIPYYQLVLATLQFSILDTGAHCFFQCRGSGFIGDPEIQEKPLYHKREHPALQIVEFFLSSWLDPDSRTPLNPEPIRNRNTAWFLYFAFCRCYMY